MRSARLSGVRLLVAIGVLLFACSCSGPNHRAAQHATRTTVTTSTTPKPSCPIASPAEAERRILDGEGPVAEICPSTSGVPVYFWHPAEYRTVPREGVR